MVDFSAVSLNVDALRRATIVLEAVRSGLEAAAKIDENNSYEQVREELLVAYVQTFEAVLDTYEKEALDITEAMLLDVLSLSITVGKLKKRI